MRSPHDVANMIECPVGLDIGLCRKRFGSTGDNESTEVARRRHAPSSQTKNAPMKPLGPLAAFTSELIEPQPKFRNEAKLLPNILLSRRPLAGGACPGRACSFSTGPCRARAPRHTTPLAPFVPRHGPVRASFATRHSPVHASIATRHSSLRAIAAPPLTPFCAIVGPALALVHAGRL